jgi:hypothetical protein
VAVAAEEILLKTVCLAVQVVVAEAELQVHLEEQEILVKEIMVEHQLEITVAEAAAVVLAQLVQEESPEQ